MKVEIEVGDFLPKVSKRLNHLLHASEHMKGPFNLASTHTHAHTHTHTRTHTLTHPCIYTSHTLALSVSLTLHSPKQAKLYTHTSKLSFLLFLSLTLQHTFSNLFDRHKHLTHRSFTHIFSLALFLSASHTLTSVFDSPLYNTRTNYLALFIPLYN